MFPIRKKLRGGPTIDVDPQILRWREKRKKLGLYKPARKPKTLHNAPESPITHDQPVPSTPVAEISVEDLWERFK